MIMRFYGGPTPDNKDLGECLICGLRIWIFTESESSVDFSYGNCY